MALRVAVCSLDAPEHACAQLRIVRPLERAGAAVELRWASRLEAGGLEVDLPALERADLIVISRLLPQPSTVPLLDRIFALGVPVLYELDDLLTEIPEDNPYFALAEQNRPCVIDALQRASAVTVSTSELRDALSCYSTEVHALPNAIDAAWFPAPERVQASGDPLTIVYAGTASHEADLGEIEPALARICERYRERLTLWLFGCSTRALRALPGTFVQEAEAGYASYTATLARAGASLGLAPLRDLPFNRCKSAIKWLEYSACGIPGVYADLPPYRAAIVDGEDGRLASSDPDSWYEAIRELIENEPLRLRMAAAARRKALAAHGLDRLAPRYRDLYARIARPPARVRVSGPRCSVVIPIFNRLDLTRQCLETLERSAPRASVEWIVVDDGSSDGSAEWLSRHWAISASRRLLQGAGNQGFARACNLGARMAQGELVVFLNNDTIPLSGWLDALVSAHDSGERVGVVGSQLLFPDDTVQHAGVVMCALTGDPYHLNYGVPRSSPLVQRRRELLAVTGACMLVRRDLFAELDGFDDGYRNGFEDIDLCLRAMLRGWRLLYEPSSVLYHLESQSPGRKQHEGVNLVRFRSRWGLPRFSDEFRQYFASGAVACVKQSAECNLLVLRRFASIHERRAWARIAQIQARVPRGGPSVALEALGSPALLPVEALDWAARLCESGGDLERAAALRAELVRAMPGDVPLEPRAEHPRGVL